MLCAVRWQRAGRVELNMYQIISVVCVLTLTFAESLAKTAADPNAHLFPTSPPILQGQDERRDYQTQASQQKYLLEIKRSVARTNDGIFSDCFGARIDKGSPLDEMIYNGARVCWQTLCTVPNVNEEEANDANARYSG